MRVTARVRAFTLVELLVVIAIIAVLTSILLPVVGGARKAARRAASLSMITDYTTAASRFANDNADRMPGYFSEQDMGARENFTGDRAFLSASENAMIDLAGQNAIWNDPDTNQPGGYSEVGPFVNGDDRNILLNPDLIGADDGAYFSPGGSFLTSLAHGSQQVSPNNRVEIPDVVDAFGNPVLVWSQDLGGRGSINPDASGDPIFLQFARADSDDADAWFYLYSNAAFLGNGGVGSSGRNQAGDPTGQAATSAIGLWDQIGTDFEEQARTLAAVLGSPAYPVLAAGNTLDTAGYEEIFPARPRGRFMVQSAGANGYYLGSNEQGWGANAHAEGSSEFHLDFGNSFKSQSDVRYAADDGGFTSIDLLEGFDDLLSSSGN
jgi:prepilin-type N-terminal cleavage/methylation domain-containing protein